MLIEAPKIKKQVIAKINDIVGPGAYSIRNLDRLNYSRDSSFRSAIQIRYNKIEHWPDVIVWPSSTEEVVKLVKMAAKHRLPIVPYGAGSGVCEGAVPVKGGMVVDLKRMHQLLSVDEDSLLATAQSGMMGLKLEEELNRKGFTLGHFPSSILCASFGGYLAARSAGQLSSRYGKIEDMVRSLEIVTGRGEVIQTRPVANNAGLDLNQMFLGSEGTLGVITQGTCRIWPIPEKKLFRGIRFKDLKTGIEAVRRLSQSTLKPAVVRLYDDLDTLMLLSHKDKPSLLPKFFSDLGRVISHKSLRAALAVPKFMGNLIKLVPGGCVLILMHEGHEKLADAEQKITMEICKGLGGVDLGPEPGKMWYERRYSVSFKAAPLFVEGAFTDTIEIATNWDNMYPVYKAMVAALSPLCLVMAHLSHVYSDGGALYFTFAAPMKGLRKSEESFDHIWDTAMKVAQKMRAVISHHHGIGRLKSPYIAEEWGALASVYQQLKKACDPHRIMNPGKLYAGEKGTARLAAA